MTPHHRRSNYDRREFLALGLAAGAAAISGCTTPLTRGQTPDEGPLEGPQLEYVGDYTRPWGLNWVKVESVALVTGLANTGSDPPPGEQRQRLIGEMMSHEVRQADKILASPTTSLVLIRGYLPPGVQKGDTFDVEVRVPQRSETTSLRNGWLMQTRLRQMEVMGGSIHTGNVDGLAQGDVLVDAVFDGPDDPVLETRARVLGGGVSAMSRSLGLAISRGDASIRISTLIGSAVNARFHTFDAGVKKGVAIPKRDNFLELSVAPRYKNNLGRYLRVMRRIALRENPIERTERLQLLGKKLLEPTTSAEAAIELEAMGTEAAATLKAGLSSTDAEVRFYSAEALAYLDEADAAAALGEAARDESAFRWHALTALSTMSDVSALDALNELLHVESVETRYGAFRALRTRNASDPATKGEVLEKKFRYHLVPTTGEPLVHIARSRVPEIVVFGHEQTIRPPKFLFAGRQLMVTGLEDGELKVGRFLPGQETKYETCPPTLDKLIRTIVQLGGGYAEVIQCLQEARKAGCVDARIAIEALAQPNREFQRNDDSGSDDPSGDTALPSPLASSRVSTPAPELFTDGLQAATASDPAEDESAAAPGETYVAPEYAKPQEKGFFDRLNPFGGE